MSDATRSRIVDQYVDVTERSGECREGRGNPGAISNIGNGMRALMPSRASSAANSSSAVDLSIAAMIAPRLPKCRQSSGRCRRQRP